MASSFVKLAAGIVIAIVALKAAVGVPAIVIVTVVSLVLTAVAVKPAGLFVIQVVGAVISAANVSLVNVMAASFEVIAAF